MAAWYTLVEVIVKRQANQVDQNGVTNYDTGFYWEYAKKPDWDAGKRRKR